MKIRESSHNPFPHDKILHQTKLKAPADDNSDVTKIIISVFDRLENIEGKGEIACKAISTFPTMFSKGFYPRCVKRCYCVGMGQQVENGVGKGEIACYEQFLLFPQCFQKACFQGASNVSLCGNSSIFYQAAKFGSTG